nr:hypothetical protein [uncultured Rhodopila sp.]
MRKLLATAKQRFVLLISLSDAAFPDSVPGAVGAAILGVTYILTAALVKHQSGWHLAASLALGCYLCGGLLRLAAKL